MVPSVANDQDARIEPGPRDGQQLHPQADQRQVQHQQHEVGDQQAGDQAPDQRRGLLVNSSGPGCSPNCWKPASMIAAVAVVGRPSVSSGTSVPAADALLAASGPATPSIAPWPNSSGCLASCLLDRVGQEGADLGAARRHRADREADRRAAQPRLPRARPVLAAHPDRALDRLDPSHRRVRGARRRCSVSPTAKSATASVVTSMPSSRSGMPKASRAWPVCRSMPIEPERQAEEQRGQPAQRASCRRPPRR